MQTKFNINLSKAFLLFLSVVIELLLYPKIQAVGDIKKSIKSGSHPQGA